MLDGGLARLQNRVTRFGAFLDSTLDRWGEGVVYIGIVAGASAAGFVAGAALAAAAAVSSFQVSYTRAKAESLDLHGEVGIAPRAERLVLLTVGLVAAGLDGGVAAGARGQTLAGARPRHHRRHHHASPHSREPGTSASNFGTEEHRDQ